jgi:hypothetical protein
MKHLLRNITTVTLLSLTSNLFSQVQFGINTRYAMTNKLGLDFKLGYQSVIFNVGFTTQLNKGLEGEQMNNVGWRQFPEDQYKKGTYYEFVDLGIHYLLHKNILIGAKIGLGSETEYWNCYDRFEILGNNGYYYKSRKSGNEKTNLGFDLDYVWNLKNSGVSLITGLSWSNQYRLGLNIGYFVSI